MTRVSPAEPDADALRVVDAPWWERAVFYQIYPRSFADSNGDGIGDLAGIRAHLADLAWLGVDALWLSPFYRLADGRLRLRRQRLLRRRPALRHPGRLRRPGRRCPRSSGCKVIIDWVPNHTSDRHPWFVDAAFRHGQRAPELVRLARPRAPTERHPTTGWPPSTSRRRPGRSTRRPASGTSTCSSRPNRTSTGTSRRSWRPCTTCCGSGSTAGWTGSGPT